MNSRIGRLAAIVLAVITVTFSSLGLPRTLQSDSAADAVVARWVDAGHIPGAVLLVSRDEQVVFEKAYGWSQLYEYDEGQYGASAAGESQPTALERLADPLPMTTDTVFDLASVTKVMATTFAVMLLVDAGELDLDATVDSYLPDFHDTEAAINVVPDAAGKWRITPRRLLTHRAGLYQWKPVYYHGADSGQAYTYIRDLGLGWPVDEGRHYSDLGFMLLGRVVEQISGQRLDEFVYERLYEPLGLTATGFRPARASAAASPAGPFAATSHGNPYEHRMVHDNGFGYRYWEDADTWDDWRRYTLVGEVNDGNAHHAFEGVAGHAGLFANAADLQVLLQLLLNRGEHGGRRFIDADIVDRFLTPTGDGQALGWQIPEGLPAGSFAHAGFTGTYVVGIPAANVAVVLLTNRQNLGVDDEGSYPDIGELQRAVVAAVR